MNRLLNAIDRLMLRARFPGRQLQLITDAVARAEAKTSGEIRVVILARFEDGVSDIKTQAEREFLKHGLQQTRDKTGVLLLIVLKNRQCYVMADKGLNDQLDDAFLGTEITYLSKAIGNGQATAGICEMVGNIGSKLAEFFPPREDDVNELSDAPILGA